MELSPGLRRLVFVVIVVLLAALGIYLLGKRGSDGTPAAAPSTPAPSPVSSSSSASVPPTMVPTTAAPVSTAGGAEIYQWLPFTAADLTTAANTTTAFAKAYVTWSYTESAATYGATFKDLATSEEITTLEEGYSTAGLAQTRTADKQVSTGSVAIDSIRSFGTGPTSITFLVTITNQVTSTPPSTGNGTQQYAITVASSGTAWQVNDIELAQLGNS